MVLDYHAQSLGFSHQHQVKLACWYVPVTLALRNRGSPRLVWDVWDPVIKRTKKPCIHLKRLEYIKVFLRQRNEMRNQQQREVWETHKTGSHMVHQNTQAE